jgi:sulfur carrier protein
VTSPRPGAVEIVVNGEPMVVPATITLERLLVLAGAPTRGVAIALGGEVVPRSAWRRTTVDAGARIEIVSAAAGG